MYTVPFKFANYVTSINYLQRQSKDRGHAQQYLIFHPFNVFLYAVIVLLWIYFGLIARAGGIIFIGKDTLPIGFSFKTKSYVFSQQSIRVVVQYC